MKVFAAVLAISLALVSLACGVNDAATTADQGNPGSEAGRHPKPEIDPPDRPPPKKLLVQDIRSGTGPIAHRGDEVAVWYLGVIYETGEERFSRWPPSAPLTFRLGFARYGDDFEAGIVGMRPGGRRDLVVPAGPEVGGEAIDYIVDLVRVKPTSQTASGG